MTETSRSIFTRPTHTGGGTVLWVVTVGLAGFAHLRSGPSRLREWAPLAPVTP